MPFISFSDNLLQDAYFFQKIDQLNFDCTKHTQSWFEVQLLCKQIKVNGIIKDYGQKMLLY